MEGRVGRLYARGADGYSCGNDVSSARGIRRGNPDAKIVSFAPAITQPNLSSHPYVYDIGALTEDGENHLRIENRNDADQCGGGWFLYGSPSDTAGHFWTSAVSVNTYGMMAMEL